MKRRMIVTLFFSALLLCAVSGRTEQPNPTAAFMRLKLAHAQKLLEGIVLEDFSLIEKNAQEMSLLSEEERWQVFHTTEYLQHSQEFRRSAKAMMTAAREKNIDGAALAYMQITHNCVNCHKYVRDVRMAQADVPASPASGRN